MPFQTTIRSDIGAGIVGDLALEGPLIAQPGIITSGTPANNVIGRAFTHTATEGVMAAGGAGVFAGILANRAEYFSLGTAADGSLAPTMTLPNGVVGDFVKGTPGIFVTLANAFNIGDQVTYVNATGELGAIDPGGEPPGGSTIISGAFVVRYNSAAPGLAVISLGYL